MKIEYGYNHKKEIKISDVKSTAAIVVGTPQMIHFSVQELLKLGIPEENIWMLILQVYRF